jgi:DHA1 family inner membrane transport protein
LLALAVGGFGIGTGEFVALGLLPNIAASVHVSIPRAGYVISAYALGVVVGAPLLTGFAVRFAGLTIANIVGVPLSTLIGQHAGWRIVFALVGLIQPGEALGVLTQVPSGQGNANSEHANIRHELRAFRNPQIWLALAIATIGGAALFCTFSYITPMMTTSPATRRARSRRCWCCSALA